MAVMRWLRQRRINKLRVQLAMVQAEIGSDEETARKTGTVYPVAAAVNAREKAKIVEILRQLGDER
jgi:hypothetical protein